LSLKGDINIKENIIPHNTINKTYIAHLMC